jgi:xylose isomerase
VICISSLLVQRERQGDYDGHDDDDKLSVAEKGVDVVAGKEVREYLDKGVAYEHVVAHHGCSACGEGGVTVFYT